MNLPHIFEHRIGQSVEGRAILAKARFDLSGDIPRGGALLIGGIHGDEAATIELLESFLQKHLATAESTDLPAVVIPLANPDSRARNSRYNAHGVDINRNFETNWHTESEEPSGAGPCSEPETRALRNFMLRMQPARIVSLHWALAEIDADGPQSTALAFQMWHALDAKERGPYRVRVSEEGHGLRRLQQTYDICPGSLGQWCGYGLQYADGSRPAMITLELPYDPQATSRPSPLPDSHLDELRERWKSDAHAYLAGVETGVHKMLHAACTRITA